MYNGVRVHTALAGRTPQEAFEQPVVSRRYFETRPRWPHREGTVAVGLELVVGHLAGREQLPVVGLRRVA